MEVMLRTIIFIISDSMLMTYIQYTVPSNSAIPNVVLE